MGWLSKYTLLDAARLQQQIHKAKELNQNHTSLYKGRSEERLADVSPYLFTIEKNPDFINWYKKDGWGNAWGMLIQTPGTFEEIHVHFIKFLLVKTGEGQQLYFRFYDPRVLRIFLPTCDVQQLKEFFGPVEKFICEDEDPLYALVFSFNGKALVTERITAETFFASLKEESVNNETPIINKENAGNENVNTVLPKPRRRFFFDD